jgi:hypothetical protein
MDEDVKEAGLSSDIETDDRNVDGCFALATRQEL